MAGTGRERVGTQLAESMLDAVGSLHQLQKELDRISLRHCGSGTSSPRARCTRSSKKKRPEEKTKSLSKSRGEGIVVGEQDQQRAQDTISLGSSTSCEHPSSLSSSSHFDSAIGSLHSQTDNDSFASQLFYPPTPRSSPKPSLRELNQTPSHPTVTVDSYHGPPGPTTTIAEARVEHYFSPQLAMPTTLFVAEHVQTKQCTPLKSQDSTQSVWRVDEDRFQGGDNITEMGTRVQLRQKSHREKATHHQLTAEVTRRHLKWLQSSESASRGEADQDHHGTAKSEVELESEGSSSTVVAEEVVERDKSLQQEIHERTPRNNAQPASSNSAEATDEHTDPRMDLQKSQHYPSRSQCHHTDPLQERAVSRKQREHQHQLPRRNASFLQRLRRKRGNFRRDIRPRRHLPVQRSFSDRFVYHLRKRWEDRDREEVVYPISTPSLLRPIGRLLRTYAGRLHVIQLHKPADGQYGIYITQGVDNKIFVSRFATATAKKFYAGLLSPGDEIVSVNKLKIRGKSLDSVYTLLSELDSVIIAVVPVTAHRNW